VTTGSPRLSAKHPNTEAGESGDEGADFTQTASRIIRLVVRSEYKRGMPNAGVFWRLELEQLRARILPE
jgi:hypothetical protein